MSGRFTLVLLALLALFAVVKAGGVNGKAVFLFTFLALAVGIQYFFDSRRFAPPSRFETFAATVWLFLRRLICFAGGIFFLIASVVIGFNLLPLPTEPSLLSRIGIALLLLLVSAVCVWVAIVGKVSYLSWLREDISHHRENKRKYHWRW